MDISKRTAGLVFYLLFCLSLALSWFFHIDSFRFIHHNELWSDRAGYYIYLPATFFYGWDARRMPSDLDIQTGGGFSIDTVNNRIDTKYTCGVALMASPFFITAGVISRIGGFHSEEGFSLIYMRMMMLAAVVYLIAGLWLLYLFLTRIFSRSISMITILLVFAGTNLFYYSLIDGLMSHVYSFFLFALFLYTWQSYLKNRAMRYFLLMSGALALAILVRPTSALLIIILLGWDVSSWRSFRHRLVDLLSARHILPLVGIISLVMVPQMVYWHYLTGQWLHFSYRGEGFTNLLNPRLAEVLFSPVNGLLTYAPLAFFMLAGIVLMIARRSENRWPVAVMFAAVTLVSASWKMWYFGCSLGQRPFIEYYTLFAIPLAMVVRFTAEIRRIIPAVVLTFLLLFTIYFNLRFTLSLYRYDRCYYGSTWHWAHYHHTLGKAGLLYAGHHPGSFENDFENLAIYPGLKPATSYARSGRYAVAAQPGETELLYQVPLDNLGYPLPKTLSLEAWMLTPGPPGQNMSIDLQVMRRNTLLFSGSRAIDSVFRNNNTWTKVTWNYTIPDVNDTGLVLKMVMRNGGSQPLFTDDLTIGFSDFHN